MIKVTQPLKSELDNFLPYLIIEKDVLLAETKSAKKILEFAKR